MSLFWLYGFGLALLSAVFVFLPLRGSKRDGVSNSSSQQVALNLDLHAQRLEELKIGLEEGALDPEAYAIQVDEAQRVLLEDAEIGQLDNRGSAPNPTLAVSDRTIGIFSAAALLLLSWVWFSDTGFSQGALAELALTEKILESRSAPQSRSMLLELIESVEAVRSVSPDNEQIEFYLGQLRLGIGDVDEAAEIFEGLVGRYPSDGELLGYLAESRYRQQGQNMTEDVKAMIQRALKIDPSNVGLLEISGMEAFKSGDSAAATRWFEQALVHATGPRAELIETLLADLKGRRSGQGSIEPGEVEQDSQVASRVDDGPSFPGRQIKVRVRAAAGLELPKGALVFVFARALEGPPMPLAVIRREASDLPLELTLDESMAMMPGLSLAEFDEVVVIARVSATGEAIAQPGDIETTSGALSLTRPSVQVELVLRDDA